MGEPGQALAVPEDFPVSWQHAEEAGLFWTRESVHFPDPVVALFDAFAQVHDAGFRAAFETYGVPVGAYHLRRINTYVYASAEPLPLPGEEMRTRTRQAEEQLRSAASRLMERWRGELLPELEGHLAYWRSLRLGEVTQSQLLDLLEDTLDRQRRLWEIHFLVMVPTLFAMSQFDEFYNEVLPGGDAFASYRLVQGLGNKTLEVDRALWQLGRMARDLEPVRRALDLPAREAVQRMGDSGEGRRFRQALDAFLARYGERGDHIMFSEPSWVEDPTTVLKNIRDFARDDARDPEAEWRQLSVARERAIAECRQRLAAFPRPVIDEFENLLRCAQEATIISEDHAHYIDHSGMYHLRRVLVEVGRRLARRGAIREPADVFMLRLDEIRAGLSASDGADGFAPAVADRRAEMAHFARITPPPALGTRPGEEPPQDALTIAIGKFFGRPPEDPGDAEIVRGQPGSPGTARGTAKVVLSLTEAAKLQPGDVLVTPTTLPPWTALFATAAAVVTDTGGVLSHCAIVAREYGIPAVVGTGRASSVLKDGDTVEVRGDQGEVRVLARSRPA